VPAAGREVSLLLCSLAEEYMDVDLPFEALYLLIGGPRSSGSSGGLEALIALL
jgi:hypothetical protein